MSPVDPKTDIILGDILIAFEVLGMQSEIAARYIQYGADDRLVTLIEDAADRARSLVRLKHALLQAKRDADLNGEAAAEYRAERGDRPSRRSAA